MDAGACVSMQADRDARRVRSGAVEEQARSLTSPMTVAGMVKGLAASWSRPVVRKASCAFQRAPHPQACALLWHARRATAHACGLVRRGACGSSAGWRAAYIADVERLRSRPGFEHHPLETGPPIVGHLRCTVHAHTPSHGGARRGPRLARPLPTGDAHQVVCRRTDELREGAGCLRRWRLVHVCTCVHTRVACAMCARARMSCTVDRCAQVPRGLYIRARRIASPDAPLPTQ